VDRILVCTDGSSFADSVYKYGAWFAGKLNSAVDVLYVTDIRTQQSMGSANFSGAIGVGASQSLLKKLVELEHEKAKLNHEQATVILNHSEEVLKAEGIGQVNLIHHTGFLVDSLDEFEENADLMVLGKRGGNAAFAQDHLGSNVERILRASHKPCLVTPERFKPIQKVLFAYDGSPSCKKMLNFCLKFDLLADLQVHGITIEKDADHPRHREAIDELMTSLETAGYSYMCELIKESHPEQAIADYITSAGIDLLLMGAYGHNRLRHLVIGSITAQTLRVTNIPVLLYR
jgi:nucleotide-binding universal stress UspA family protein